MGVFCLSFLKLQRSDFKYTIIRQLAQSAKTLINYSSVISMLHPSTGEFHSPPNGGRLRFGSLLDDRVCGLYTIVGVKSLPILGSAG